MAVSLLHNVMAGEGPPPTTYAACLDEVVGGGPSPAMTIKGRTSP